MAGAQPRPPTRARLRAFRRLLRADDRLIGDCGLELMEVSGEQVAELGYDFRRDCWNRGYATEAACAVRDFAFGTLCLPRLVSLIQPGNPALGACRSEGRPEEHRANRARRPDVSPLRDREHEPITGEQRACPRRPSSSGFLPLASGGRSGGHAAGRRGRRRRRSATARAARVRRARPRGRSGCGPSARSVRG